MDFEVGGWINDPDIIGTETIKRIIYNRIDPDEIEAYEFKSGRKITHYGLLRRVQKGEYTYTGPNGVPVEAKEFNNLSLVVQNDADAFGLSQVNPEDFNGMATWKDETNVNVTCTCNSRDLFNFGCQCGYLTKTLT